MATRQSAAKRVRLRRRSDVHVFEVPLPPVVGLGHVGPLVIKAAGVKVPVPGAQVTIEHTKTGASTLTLTIADARDNLVNGALLDTDEDAILDAGITIELDGIVYRLSIFDVQEAGVPSLTFIDEVAWRLTLNTRPLKVARGQATRAEFVLRLVNEARRKPQTHFDVFIPELDDTQPIAKGSTAQAGQPGGKPGFAGDAHVTVKGAGASTAQRAIIDTVLATGNKLGASDRVLIAAVMCITQESGVTTSAVNGIHIGLYQQNPAWGSDRTDPAASTRYFLIDGPSAWKKVHGSLRNASGDLAQMIEAVQHSGIPSAYAQWQTEATRTVKAWDPDSDAPATSDAGTKVKRYEFTRGDSGKRESTWAATARLAEEVGWSRWACANTFYYVSDDELRRAKPVLTIYPSTGWLLGRSFTWNASRPVVELTLRVLANRWAALPGSLVAIGGMGPANGRYLVNSVRRTGLTNPEAEITLHRPIGKKPEPAPDSGGESDRSGSTGQAADGVQAAYDRAVEISQQNLPYAWGGGHPSAGSPSPGQRGEGTGYDCSGYTAAQLVAGGWMRRGVGVPGSGDFPSLPFLKPGRGKHMTICSTGSHVWVAYEDLGRYKRADTGGGPPSGPHVRTEERSMDGFTLTHPEGA